jgi:hypothetical protein
MQQAAEETWREVAGPPTEEGAKRLNLVAQRVKLAKERYSKVVDRMKGAEHTQGEGEAFVRKLENASEAPDPAQTLLHTIDDAVWHLAELWPLGELKDARPEFLKVNLELQRSARRWRRLSMSKPYEVIPELDLVSHRHDIAGAALQLLQRALDLYIHLLVFSKHIREAGIKPGSYLDQLVQAEDTVDKLLN